MDFIPEDFEIKQLRAEYKSQAVLDDEICPFVAVSEEGKLYTVVLNNKDGRPYCIVEMLGR